jgi:3-demethoxyubiquinol 3-hydroxylase
MQSLAEQKKVLCCLGTTRISRDASASSGYSRGPMKATRLSAADTAVAVVDQALRSLTSTAQAARPTPTSTQADDISDAAARRISGALMRVNHVGEVCAQALYSAQALTTPSASLRRQFQVAAAEETDHLAWTAVRLRELGARPSLLNPVWYLGAFSIGLLAGRAGDEASLGFIVETERQVERHLEGHLDRLPAGDFASRAIVRQMKEDEARHALAAETAGAARLPWPLRLAMRVAAKVMTTTAHYI